MQLLTLPNLALAEAAINPCTDQTHGAAETPQTTATQILLCSLSGLSPVTSSKMESEGTM